MDDDTTPGAGTGTGAAVVTGVAGDGCVDGLVIDCFPSVCGMEGVMAVGTPPTADLSSD